MMITGQDGVRAMLTYFESQQTGLGYGRSSESVGIHILALDNYTSLIFTWPAISGW